MIWQEYGPGEYGRVWSRAHSIKPPTEEWQWKIEERDYLTEASKLKAAFLQENGGPKGYSVSVWDHAKVMLTIRQLFLRYNRPIPYVNTLWLVIAEKEIKNDSISFSL